MLFNANKKNKANLKFINEYIERLEDIKTSNKYDIWTLDNEILLQNARIKKEQYEIAIQRNKEIYLKNIMFISKVVCSCAIGGALAYNATKKKIINLKRH